MPPHRTKPEYTHPLTPQSEREKAIWRQHLRAFLAIQTSAERRRYRYHLALELGCEEGTVRGYLRKANGGEPLPPPAFPGQRFGERIRIDKLTTSHKKKACKCSHGSRSIFKVTTTSVGPSCSTRPRTSHPTSMKEVIDLCDSDSESQDEALKPLNDSANTKSPMGSSQPATTKTAKTTVPQYLDTLGLPHLVHVFRDLGFITAEDLNLLWTCPESTREAVLKAIRKDGRVQLKDWSILHASIHSGSKGEQSQCR
ncbi:hypothetical protein BXZ70DRAFT_169510 [Cristinia sonorae]|uniref:Uncharacterized protein n=1 Tax=Cristinia sonorae TaxID=1940300 RepID=A0A8K0XPU3_9AGAR|nr:hypothetical protein BXZ70DRAFT_169510 [Cristinia sonorae]